ncbi:hypothetical protein [Methylobacterium nodulans]|nr:hypothetical protein [Methylobacterium nodulans]
MVFAWIALGVPLLATAAVALLGLNPVLRSGVILSVLAPPVGSAAALATTLGLRPRLALLTSIALTVASPALMPLLAMLLRADVSLDTGHLAWRLIAVVGSAALIAAMARRWRARLTAVLPDALAAAGVAVIGLVIVGLAVTDGVRAQIAVAPDTFAPFVTAAVGVNLAAGPAGTALFWPWGSWDAMTVGLVSGNRNVTLAWAAAGATLAPEGEAYIAACAIPILSLPLLLKTAFALRARGARASGSTAT